MAADDVLARAVDGIADGAVVNWPQLHGLARSDEERDHLKWLQVLGHLANVHRSAPQSIEEDAGMTRAATTAEIAEAHEVWGRYRLVRKLGAGSFGSVYSAWDPQLERYVAIKILHAHVEDDRTRQRLLREGRALAKVQHGNVVQVFGVEAHGSRVGLCMEIISGETLSDVLRSHGRLNDREAAAVGEDVCRALAAVHAAGYVHRDVKAQNVMRDKTGKIVLMDFGTGQDARRRTADLVGTPLYMAPEVLAGEPASVQSDVYAVGVLLYHLVTGHYPVEGRTELDVIDAHQAGRRRPLLERRADLPMPFVQVVSKALAPNPAERWASAGAMLEALGGLAGRATTEDRSWASTIARATGLAFACVASLTALGMVNSRFFNVALGREAFVAEGPRDWLYWGAISMVAPLVLVLLVLIGLSLLRVAFRMLLRFWAGGRRALTAIPAGARRLGFDDAEAVAAAALVSSLALVGATVWLLLADIGILLDLSNPNVSTAPLASLAYLSPSNAGQHENYRLGFEWLAIVLVAMWWLLFKEAARQRQRISMPMKVSAAAIVLLTFFLMDFPYRLLYQADFDSVDWQGQQCAVLGERNVDYLLFCPGLEPPRNRIVRKDTSEIRHLGVRLNPFAHASIPLLEQR